MRTIQATIEIEVEVFVDLVEPYHANEVELTETKDSLYKIVEEYVKENSKEMIDQASEEEIDERFEYQSRLRPIVVGCRRLAHIREEHGERFEEYIRTEHRNYRTERFEEYMGELWKC